MIYDFLKRVLDLTLSCVLLILFLPVIVVVSIAIKVESEGPILADTPPRMGRNGKLFKMYKFRSMVKNAHEMLTHDKEFKALFEEYKNGGYKLRNDPRITKVGKFIRKYSLDEVPQFLNVIKGEMSLVGPRAYYADEIKDQQKKHPDTKDAVKVVMSVKPGVTGVWQVSGRSDINFEKRINLDADYAKRKSIYYDIYLIAKTPLAMLSGKGAM